MYTESAPTRHSRFFRISSSIDNVKHIFVYFKKKETPPPASTGKQGDNPYIFTLMVGLDNGDVKLSNCRLEYGNGVFYPETEYDTDFKLRIYYDLMSYASRKNDYNSGTQLNTSNFNSLYGMIYFDLTFQSEKGTRDPKELIFRYKLTQTTTNYFNVHAIVLYDEEA